MNAAAQHRYTAREGDELRGEAKAAIEVYTKAAIRVCELLYRIYYGSIKMPNGDDVPLAIAWKYRNFYEYAEKEAGFHEGRAHRYIMVYDELCVRRNFAALDLPWSITRLMDLAAASRKLRNENDEKTFEKMVKGARELTCCDFEDLIETEVFGGRSKRRSLSFSMKWGHAATVAKHIREARDNYDVETNGEALLRIVQEWAGGHAWQAARPALRKTGTR